MRKTPSEAGLLPGQILRLRRKRRRLDQTKVGALLDTSQSRISQIEAGALRPTLEQAAAIEREFGIPAATWARTREDSTEVEAERESA